METLFRVGESAKQFKTPDPQRILGLGSPSNLNTFHYKISTKIELAKVPTEERGDEACWMEKY